MGKSWLKQGMSIFDFELLLNGLLRVRTAPPLLFEGTYSVLAFHFLILFCPHGFVSAAS